MNRDKHTKKKYQVQKGGAYKRNIAFNLTFDEWCDIWEESGKWELRGTSKGQYSMCRYYDCGAYEKNNIYIALSTDNVKHAHDYKFRARAGYEVADYFDEYNQRRGETNPYYNLAKDEKPFKPRFDP